MSSIAKTHKLSIYAMFIAAALIGSVVAVGDSYAYAGGKKKSNDAEQEIEQGQASEQKHNVYLVTLQLLHATM